MAYVCERRPSGGRDSVLTTALAPFLPCCVGVAAHQSTPSDPYPKKYFGKHAGRPLDPMLARTYARQILEVRPSRRSRERARLHGVLMRVFSTWHSDNGRALRASRTFT